jgi:hypothetical protein
MAGQIPTKRQIQEAAKAAQTKKAPGKAVAKTNDAKPESKSEFTPAKAKVHTENIAKAGSTFGKLLLEAYKGRIWFAMGYTTWQQYLDGEFGGAPLQLPRDKRKIEALELAKGGMSTRAIAAATGVSKSSVANDIVESSTVHKLDSSNELPPTDDSTPPDLDGIDGDPCNIIDGQVVSSDEIPRTTIGLDGKERAVTAKPVQPKDTVVDIASVTRVIAKDIANITVRLGDVIDRDDYVANEAVVDQAMKQAISDFVTEASGLPSWPALKDAISEPQPY